MKQYQDHDPVADKGKAIPKPKRPTHASSKRMPALAFRNHSESLYRTAPRKRRDGTIVQIRTDCCTKGHGHN